MRKLTSPSGIIISYEKNGKGPPLVLVHGSFSDHRTNWAFVRSSFEKNFTVYAIARRGRGETDATKGHGVTDEAEDVAALIDSAGEQVFLLGHSYGAQVALAAAALLPNQIRKMILYEPPWPHNITKEQMEKLENLARASDWEAFVTAFFRDTLAVHAEEIEKLHATEPWNTIVADAEASLHDLRALSRYQFEPESFRNLGMPIMLQIGTESPRELYVTDTLAPVLPDVQIEAFHGQAHEAMNTAPLQYGNSVLRFLS
jgi:pimeloyl-ACP methyl ester carboxylesterase